VTCPSLASAQQVLISSIEVTPAQVLVNEPWYECAFLMWPCKDFARRSNYRSRLNHEGCRWQALARSFSNPSGRLMPPSTKTPLADVPDIASDEEHMRRALGLASDGNGRAGQPRPEQSRSKPSAHSPARGSSAPRPRHRFVQDGDVPVALVSRQRPQEADMPDGAPTSRVAIEAALHQERAARERAERSLQEALATVRDLQTKLGHAELAQREASETAQAARDAADALQAAHQEREARWHEDLTAGRPARAVVEVALTEAVSARKPAKQTRRTASVAAPAAAVQGTATKPAKAPVKNAPKGTRKASSTPREREPQPVKWWLKPAKWR